MQQGIKFAEVTSAGVRDQLSVLYVELLEV